MSSSRRTFLKQSAGLAGLLLVDGLPVAAAATTKPVLVNHVGFTPNAAKFCLLEATAAIDYSVIDTRTNQPAFHGAMTPIARDLGNYAVGEFTQLQQPGSFYIQAGGSRSGAFMLAADVYETALRQSVDYFAKQRCGDSKTGYHAPCHLDDGHRRDNGQLQDVTGGWHDACDLRKWVNATLYGMTGLRRLLEVLGPQWERARVIEELRWGNQYFRKMQDPAGFVMDYCGGDDGNHWTDNRRGSRDDRPIHVDPCELPSQFHFVATQAALARHLREEDPAYARGCEQSARRCLQWCLEKPLEFAQSLSAAILAAVEMHRAAGGDEYRNLAAGYLKKLIVLQATDDDAPAGAHGFFRAEPDNPQPLRAIMHGNLPLLALCESLEYLSEHPDAPSWRKSLQSHADYLLAISTRSAFGTIPFGLYSSQDPGGNRRIGTYWYRWFMKTRDEHPDEGDWWVGINAHLASHGVGLMKAARLLQSSPISHLAQRQLDWILGVNPYDASTVTGAGRNQPQLFIADEFHPSTPPIPGGAMNGVGGSASDQPVLNPGSYNTCEYWTPMTAYTLWLLAELQGKR